jgi:signal transduction histidine kinase/ligand-binding sensor domain-containing protein/DNA-binding response OmpR family regulator
MKRIFKSTLTLLIPLSLQALGQAQVNRLQFQHVSLEQGLPAPNVYVVYQDAAGFLWFGNDKGASRFDGVTIRTIPLGPVNWFYTDKRGRLWIGAVGLSCIDLARDTMITYLSNPDDASTLGSVNVRGIVEDDDGTMWIAHDGGLDRFDPESGTFTRLKDIGLPFVSSMVDDNKGHLWIGTHNCLARLDKKSREVIRIPLDPRMSWVSMMIGPDGTVWASGNVFFGLYAIDPVSLRLTEVRENGRPIDAVRLVFDSLGAMYVGTLTNGLKIRDPVDGRWTTYRHHLHVPESIANDHVHWVYFDRAGNLWLGTANGVSWAARWQKQFFHLPNDPDNDNSPPAGSILSVVDDNAGHAWIGSWGGGLAKYDFSVKSFSRFASLGKLIHAVCSDNRGHVWVSTNEPAGLWRFTVSTGDLVSTNSLLKASAHLPNAKITAMTVDKGGNLWLGFDGISVGCISHDDNALRLYPLDAFPDVLYKSVRQVICDSKGVVWVAGGADGLVRLDPRRGEWHRLNVRKRCLSIHEDHLGRLWVGSDEGLDLLDRPSGQLESVLDRSFLMSRSEIFDVPSLMSDSEIQDIIEDDQGILWLVGARFLYRLDPATKALQEFGPDNGYSVTPRGLHSMRGTRSAFFVREGLIILGTGDGIVRFQPESVHWNNVPPPVRITDILASQSDKGGTGSFSLIRFRVPEHIDIPYDRSSIEIQFAALDFASPSGNSYALKLEGLDRDWTYIQNTHAIRYGNLPPGAYIFHVKAANGDHAWNVTGASITVIITPPWWRTPFAYFLYSCIVAGIAYGAWRMQLRKVRTEHALEMTQFEAQKLHEVDEMKSHFFTNISHEFRTPLTLILGPVMQIAERTSDEKTREELRIVHKNATTLLQLVNQLLEISKLESGSMKLQASRRNVISLLKALVVSFEPYAERKNITLNFTTTEDEIIAYVDREKIESIVTNILSNAFKFTPEGGAVSVRIQSSPLGTAAANSAGQPDAPETWPSGSVDIIVRDTGIGIPDGELPHIFDRFYQVDASQTREQEGTGIGLALTKELVELHHGTISARSVVGEGSEFLLRFPLGSAHLKSDEIIVPRAGMGERIWVPLEAPGQHAPSDMGSQTPDGTHPIVLVVEDNVDVRTYVRQYLASTYKVIEAKDGKDGVEKARESIPDLIISDVMMPNMDGYELCKTLKLDEKTSHVPIILLTAKAGQENKIEGLETGADDYITKPFDAKELLVRVKNLIELRRKLREKFSASQVLKPGEIAVTSIDDAFLKKVMEIVEERLGEETFSVEDLALEAGMSRVQLYRKMTALTGLSPSDFVRYMRLHRAMALLKKNVGTVSEIAYTVGFNGVSYFTKCFRDQFGLLPSELKKP